MINVLVAERNQVLRLGIQSVLDSVPACRVVADATSAEQLLWCFTAISYDVLLIEAGFLETVGLQTLDEYTGNAFLPKMIVYSCAHDPDQGLRALQNGAAGYLTKHCSPVELRDAISHVAMGERYIDRALAEELASFLMVSPHSLPRLLLLPHELRVYKMLALGLALSGIAAQLNLSIGAVRACQGRIADKLRGDGIVGFVQSALARGLVGRVEEADPVTLSGSQVG